MRQSHTYCGTGYKRKVKCMIVVPLVRLIQLFESVVSDRFAAVVTYFVENVYSCVFRFIGRVV